ncbi:MAG TPA: Rid family detoxifying hydrolase [Spirochaetota bacterium]|nr:Rid family detoxifying hydrolase [Spirochaetota bacterium]HOR44595.1 Rid family detoxifying hydrolase [Spirochaetota bacterium]HPK56010.1 Rid family detoxifying hydrolase [Spirochaetota bacterium]
MKKAVSGKGIPSALGPYSAAVMAGNTLYASGQIPVDETGNLISSSVSDALSVIMKNAASILSAEGMTLDNIVKTTVFSASMDYFAEFNEAYASYFQKPYPARSFIEVSKLPKNAMIEIEFIAVK